MYPTDAKSVCNCFTTLCLDRTTMIGTLWSDIKKCNFAGSSGARCGFAGYHDQLPEISTYYHSRKGLPKDTSLLNLLSVICLLESEVWLICLHLGKCYLTCLPLHHHIGECICLLTHVKSILFPSYSFWKWSGLKYVCSVVLFTGPALCVLRWVH